MALPTHEELKAAVLAYLNRMDGKQATSKDLADALAKRFKLSQADLNAKRAHTLRPGGESEWRLHLRRVKNHLLSAGAVEPGLRGVWRLRD